MLNSKTYFEDVFSIETARALQTWAQNNLITIPDGDYGMKVSYLADGEMFAETEITGLSIGVSTILRLDIKEITANQFRVYINADANDNTSSIAELGWGTGVRTLEFIPTAEIMYLAIGDNSGVIDTYSIVDNVTVTPGTIANGTFEDGTTTGWYAQNGNATIEAYEYNAEPPIVNNQYIKNISIPLYVDTGDDTDGLITEANGRWNSTYLNRTDIANFYVEYGDYIPKGRIVITKSGTATIPRTISFHNGNDLHPGMIDESLLANVAFELDNASYWVFDRLASMNCNFLGDITNGASMQLSPGSSNNIINRAYFHNHTLAISIRRNCNDNTVQNSYLNSVREDAEALDNSNIMLTDGRNGTQHIRDTHIVNNEARNFKLVKLHDSEGSANDIYFNNTVVDSNIEHYDSEIYSDSDGTPNPTGNFCLVETGTGVKSGSDVANEPVIYSNNIKWGGKATAKIPGLSSPGAGGIMVYMGVRYFHGYGNMYFGIDSGITLADKYDQERGSWDAEVYENILYQIGARTPQTAEGASLSCSMAEDMNVHNNLVKEPRDTDYWAKVKYNFENNYFGMNDVVDATTGLEYSGNHFVVDGVDPDTNVYMTGAQSDAIYTKDYTFTYMKFTNSPQQTTIPKVLKPDQERPLNEAN